MVDSADSVKGEEDELNFKQEKLTAAVDSDDSDQREELATVKSPVKEKEETEDWKKFLNLTSGIDSLIKKTQDDLGEIKKESFYQQKESKLVDKTAKAESERKKKKGKKWVDLDSGSFDDFDGEVEFTRDEEKAKELELEEQEKAEGEENSVSAEEEPQQTLSPIG